MDIVPCQTDKRPDKGFFVAMHPEKLPVAGFLVVRNYPKKRFKKGVMTMKITLKDGSVKEYAQAMSVLDIASDISAGLARVACAGEVDGERVDLRTVVDKDCTLNILTAKDEGGLATLRHTASHVMAQAIKRLYPEAKLQSDRLSQMVFTMILFQLPQSAAEDLEKIEAR